MCEEKATTLSGRWWFRSFFAMSEFQGSGSKPRNFDVMNMENGNILVRTMLKNICCLSKKKQNKKKMKV